MRPLSAFSCLLTMAGIAHAVVGPGKVTGSTNVHDPTMCKDGSGKWWLFSTGVGIEIRTSTDRTAWTYVGVVWPNGAPSATNTYTRTSNGALWAPDCTYVNNRFRLYYAASTMGSRNSGIFYATSTSGMPGSWVDGGLVLSTTTSDKYNAIDPNLIITNSGQWFLTFGSYGIGIKQVPVDNTGKLTSNTLTAVAQRSGSSTAIEAPVVFQNGNYFYLFTSWDACCSGTSSTYNIRVGRSSSVNGPFVDASGKALTSSGGTLMLSSHDAIIGPGGQDVFDDSDGPILVYHYYTSSGSYLGINRLDFSSGWPVVV